MPPAQRKHCYTKRVATGGTYMHYSSIQNQAESCFIHKKCRLEYCWTLVKSVSRCSITVRLHFTRSSFLFRTAKHHSQPVKPSRFYSAYSTHDLRIGADLFCRSTSHSEIASNMTRTIPDLCVRILDVRRRKRSKELFLLDLSQGFLGSELASVSASNDY